MKKLISLILVFILALSNLTTFYVYGSEVIEGNYKYSGGTGTVDDPYKIKTVEDLENVSLNLTASHIQTANIYLKDAGNWDPIGSSENPFNGSYNKGV
jgi:hypothetical protein